MLKRLGQIGSTEAPIQCLLIAAGVPGLFLLLRRDSVLGWACIGFCAAGFGWGYPGRCGPVARFPCSPGRHTFAFYHGARLAGGIAIDELLKRLRAGKPRLDWWAVVGTLLIGIRMIGFPGYSEFKNLRGWFAPEPFLLSQPTPRAEWIVDRVGAHLKPASACSTRKEGSPSRVRPSRFREDD